jgi:hypothetical protein
MSDDLVALAGKFDGVAAAFTGGGLRQVTERTARNAKTRTVASMSTRSLSRYGRGKRRGAVKTGARYDVKSDSTAVIKPTVPGLAALLQFGGTGPWDRKGTTFQHAPVPARHIWEQAVGRGVERVGEDVDAEVQKVLRRTFTAG